MILAVAWLIWQVAIVGFVLGNPDTPQVGFTYPEQQLGFFGMWDERVYYYMYEKLRDDPGEWLPLFAKAELPLGPAATLWVLAKSTGECKPVMWVLYSALNLAAVIPLILFGRRFAPRGLWFVLPLLFLIHPGPWRFYPGFTTEGPANTFLCLAVFAVACAATRRGWWAWSVLGGLSLFAASEFRVALRYGGYGLALVGLAWLLLTLWRRWRSSGRPLPLQPSAAVTLFALVFLAAHLGLALPLRALAPKAERDAFYRVYDKLVCAANPHVEHWRVDSVGLARNTFIMWGDGEPVTRAQQIGAWWAWVKHDPLAYVGRCGAYVWRMWVGDIRQARHRWCIETFGLIGVLYFVSMQVLIGVLFLFYLAGRVWRRRLDAVDLVGFLVLAGYTAVVLAFHSKPEYGACLVGPVLMLGLRNCTHRQWVAGGVVSLAVMLFWGLFSFASQPTSAAVESLRSLPELTRIDIRPEQVTTSDCKVSAAPDGGLIITKPTGWRASLDIHFPDQRIPVVRNMVLGLALSRPETGDGSGNSKAAPDEEDGEWEPSYPVSITRAIRLTTAPETEDLDRFEDRLYLDAASPELSNGVLARGFADGTFAGQDVLAFRPAYRINRNDLNVRDFGDFLTAVRLILPASFSTGRLAPFISVRVLPLRPGMPDEREMLARVRSTASPDTPAASATAPVEPPTRGARQTWPAWQTYANGITLRSLTLSDTPRRPDAEPVWAAELLSARIDAPALSQFVFHAMRPDGSFVAQDARLSRSLLGRTAALSAMKTVPGTLLAEAAALRLGIGLPRAPWTAEKPAKTEPGAFPVNDGLTEIPVIHLSTEDLHAIARAAGSRKLYAPGFLWPSPPLLRGEITITEEPARRLGANECALVPHALTTSPDNGVVVLWSRSGYALVAGNDPLPQGSPAPIASPHTYDSLYADVIPPVCNGERPYQVVPMGWNYRSGVELLRLLLVNHWDGHAELITDLRVGPAEAAAEDELVFRFMRAGPGIYYAHLVPEQCANGLARTRILVKPGHLRVGTALHMSVCSRTYVPERDNRLPVRLEDLGRFASVHKTMDIPMVWLRPGEADTLRTAIGNRELLSNVLIANLPDLGLPDRTQIPVVPDPLAALAPGRLALVDMRLIPLEETPRIVRKRAISTDLWLVEEVNADFVTPKKSPSIQELLQLW